MNIFNTAWKNWINVSIYHLNDQPSEIALQAPFLYMRVLSAHITLHYNYCYIHNHVVFLMKCYQRNWQRWLTLPWYYSAVCWCWGEHCTWCVIRQWSELDVIESWWWMIERFTVMSDGTDIPKPTCHPAISCCRGDRYFTYIISSKVFCERYNTWQIMIMHVVCCVVE